MENIHLLAIPLRSSHTGEQMALFVAKGMEEVCGKVWNHKLIGISTDGESNMTGKYSGTVTRLEIGTGFYACGAPHTS